MSAETLDKLWTQWKLQELDMERATGQMLQHLRRLDVDNEAEKLDLLKLANAVTAINITLASLRDDVDALIAHTKMSPRKTKKRVRSTRSVKKS